MDRKSIKRRCANRGISTEIIDIVDKYVEIVSKNYDVIAIILFGSYAKGTQREDSDIDIAIITDDIYRIEPHIISVTDYENDETPFVVEVKNTGIKVA